MDEIEFTSLITLIQSPDKFDAKRVRVIGLCTLDFEGKAIWTSREDLEKAVTKNAVWLDTKLDETTRARDKKFLLVEGTFAAQRKGHLGLYSGTIEKITRLDQWEK